jgi:hypothetical protein
LAWEYVYSPYDQHVVGAAKKTVHAYCRASAGTCFWNKAGYVPCPVAQQRGSFPCYGGEDKFALFTDETRGLETLRSRIENTMKSKLQISLKVKLVEPKTIERSIGKAKRVIDNRKI